jgi:sugar (pentulose or hexulose) kinase
MKENNCIVGVDAGTSVIKAVAFDYSGNEIAKYETPFESSRPHPLWVEQDMNEMWKVVKNCIANIARETRQGKREIKGLGITSTGDGTWMIDSDGNPVRPGMLWCDGRAGKIVERWHSKKIAQEAFDICGTAVFTGSQAAQLAWLRENEPESLEKAGTIFHAKDWLFYKLTGIVSSDETDESLTMLRMSTRQYDRRLFQIFKIEDLYSKFPRVKPNEENIGTIRSTLAEELGLPRDLLIGSGPMDVAACALGSGAIEHGQASSILGTAGIHQVIMDRPLIEPKMVGMTLCHGVRGRWMRMLAVMTATPNLDWFIREFGQGITEKADRAEGDIYKYIEGEVTKVPVGSDGVIFHPYLFPGGERGPFVKPTARASLTGLNLNHTLNHLLRAIYEGVAFSTLDCYSNMPVETNIVHLSGGGANSDVWCQIIADCLGKSVRVPDGTEFGAKGAAINVGIALGVYKNFQDAISRSVKMARFYEPDSKNTKLYHQLYEVYKMTYERQMDIWDRRASILGGEG